MEVRNLWILPLQVYTDETLKLSYLKALTQTTFETVKLPTHLSQYRYQHLIVPTNLLYIELIKTKKNWILKNILETKYFIEIENYANYLKYAELSKILMNYFQEDMEVNLLDVFLKILSETSLQNLDIKHFEDQINISLGFK